MLIGLFYELFADYEWQSDDPPDADAEFEPEETLLAIEEAIRHLGHRSRRIGAARDLLREGRALEIDVALNISEGARSRNREAYVPVLLELAGIPFLGSDALTLSVTLDKALTKDVAVVENIPTPAYAVVRAGQLLEPDHIPQRFPLFVKPRYEGSSKGITPQSRVEDWSELVRQVAWVIGRYGQDALVEEFVGGGGEFTVTVIGNDPPRVLPVLQRAIEVRSEIGLHALEHRGAVERSWNYRLGATLTPDLEDTMRAYALKLYEKLECRDFARLDFRTDQTGRPWFLEINPLPTFAPDGTFAVVAELLNRPYSELLADVLAGGLRRLGFDGD